MICRWGHWKSKNDYPKDTQWTCGRDEVKVQRTWIWENHIWKYENIRRCQWPLNKCNIPYSSFKQTCSRQGSSPSGWQAQKHTAIIPLWLRKWFSYYGTCLIKNSNYFGRYILKRVLKCQTLINKRKKVLDTWNVYDCYNK